MKEAAIGLPTGYLPEKNVDKKCQARLDPKRAPIVRQLFEKVGDEGWSGRQTYRWLDKSGFRTRTGKRLSLANLYIILRNPFYYGEFEYPVGSGEWYQGKHEPIITKDLFDRAQASIRDQYIPKTESKEFAFTKLIKCGVCGSGITADEKFKRLKDGGTNRHVYYRCTHAKDTDCANPPINEMALIEKLANLMDTLDLDEIGMRGKIEEEIARYNKFRVGVLGATKRERGTDIDIRTYAKYLLKEGTPSEKRELLSCLKTGLVLFDRNVTLSPPRYRRSSRRRTGPRRSSRISPSPSSWSAGYAARASRRRRSRRVSSTAAQTPMCTIPAANPKTANAGTRIYARTG
ncbi:MAG: recombinase family protein [Patescibacteria group bacterium]|nr:recombinase family protein [Patescibacteria group bacterium]MDE1944082.1 recombinase family protein [Patescibacteria group bacterium]MDE1945475.1 recombinase family protein [Patescibacteria group bacterium]MDE2057590.1 recombinase family protein [Patescibacteria group bacterium]